MLAGWLYHWLASNFCLLRVLELLMLAGYFPPMADVLGWKNITRVVGSAAKWSTGRDLLDELYVAAGRWRLESVQQHCTAAAVVVLGFWLGFWLGF